jgi:hypothetical protein
MKNILELNEAILKTTLLIQTNYPELIKYLNEMPISIAAEKNTKIDIQILQDYLQSLEYLLTNYQLNHHKTNNNK